MIIRVLLLIGLAAIMTACATPASRTTVMSSDSIELSQGVVKLIDSAAGQAIALENDERIRCVDLNPPGENAPSRFCQTNDEFNNNLERGKDLIRSINANPNL